MSTIKDEQINQSINVENKDTRSLIVKILFSIVEDGLRYKLSGTGYLCFRQNAQKQARIRLTVMVDQYFGDLQTFKHVLEATRTVKLVEVKDIQNI